MSALAEEDEEDAAEPATVLRTQILATPPDNAEAAPRTAGALDTVALATAVEAPALAPDTGVVRERKHVTVTDRISGVPLTPDISRNNQFPPSRIEFDIVVVTVPSTSATWSLVSRFVPADSGDVRSSTLNVTDVAAVT